MSRKPRITAPLLSFHIIIRCNNSDFLITDRADFDLFMSVLLRYKEKYRFKVFGYCIMNSHIHLFIQTPEEPGITISKIMHGICWRYAYTYNRRHKRKGHFFMERFRSPVVQEDVYGMELLRYISQNPVRAGLVKKEGDWRWSSYRVYADGEYDPVVDILPSFEGMSAEKKLRSRMFREMVEGRVMKKEESYTKSYILGDGLFVKKILTRITKPPG